MRGFLRRVFYSTQEAGRGKDRQIFLLDTSKNKISFWNDVPFKNENTGKDIFNGVIEISKNLTAKLEMAKNEKYHPLKFNEKTKKVRVAIGKHFYHLKQGFFNYGFIPQTWESPLLPNKEVLSTYGDNNPIDIIEFSENGYAPGTIIPVKVLGIFALIEDNQLDWKVIALNQEEAKTKNINTLENLELEYPNRLMEFMRLFKISQTDDSIKKNTIAFDEKIFDADKAIEIINKSNNQWKELKRSLMSPETISKSHKDALIKLAKEFHME